MMIAQINIGADDDFPIALTVGCSEAYNPSIAADLTDKVAAMYRQTLADMQARYEAREAEGYDYGAD